MSMLQKMPLKPGEGRIVLPEPEITPGADIFVRVVIPTLNEEEYLPKTLESVWKQEGPFEVVVVDGGSTDATCEIARSQGAVVVETEACRGSQLTRGARAMTRRKPEAFLFLHADTILPDGALGEVRSALAQPEVVGGRFRIGFDDPHPLLKAAAYLTRLPTRWVAFGDQGFFATRDAFERAGAFEPIPLFEDVRFYRRLNHVGSLKVLSDSVSTSARRFKPGVVRRFLLNAGLLASHSLGASPKKLTRAYSWKSSSG